MKPCIQCGEPSEATRCEEHRREVVRGRNDTRERKTNSTRWKNFSRRLRKLSPFCELCGSTERLQVDHIIPWSQRPDLEFVVENCRIACASCNSTRGDRVTDDERAMVEARLTQGGRGRGKAPLTDGKPQRALHTPGGYPVKGGEAP